MLILKSGTQHWEHHISVKYWSILKIHDIFVIRILWASQKWPKVLSNVLWSPRNCKKKKSVQSISGHPVCMYASMQICNFAGMHVCMFAWMHNMQGCKHASLPVFKYARLPVSKYASMKVYKYVSVQVSKYKYMQVCKYTRDQV